MIAALLVVVCALVHRARSVNSAAAILTVGVVSPFVAAVLVNGVRITIAMWLAAHPALLSALPPSELHRLEGLVV